MNTQYDEETGTERMMDWVVGLVGLVPKIVILLWVLLAGGVPLALQGQTADMTADRAVPTVEAPGQSAVELDATTPTDVPPEPTPMVLELIPVVDPPSIDAAGVLSPGQFTIDPGALGFTWAAQQVAGAAIDPSNRQPGLPPNLLIDLTDGNGAAATGDADAATGNVDLTRPQIRIIPISAYLEMLNQADTPEAGAAFDNLKALLDQGSMDSDDEMPTPPPLGDVSQINVARVQFFPFEGGQAVGYVAHIATTPGPVTNEDGLEYIIQGLSDDGNHYIFGVWPLGAAFLPDTAADLSDDTLSSIQADVDAYLADLDSETEAAADSDFTPDLGNLRNALATITIGSGVTAKLTGDEAAAQTAPELAGTVWQWTAFEDASGANDIAVEIPANYEIIFWGDGSYSLKADCNVGGGSYVVDGGSLTIEPGFSTLAFCGEASLDQVFRERLFNTATYVFDDDGNLVLNLFADSGNMVFANAGSAELVDAGEPQDQPAADDAGLTSTAYQWTSLTEADGTVVTIDNPENYQVIMNPDGTFNFRADCNVGSGTYEYNEDGSIVFLPGPITRVACPEGSLGDAFVQALTGTVSFTVDADGNVTADLGDGRTASLINAGPVSLDSDMVDTGMGETADIVGTTWEWARFDDTADLNNIVVPNPEDYTLTLWPDGTFSFRADCNVGSGTYELNGGALSLVVGPTTRALCAPDSLSDTFISRLGQTGTYIMNGEGQLVLNLMADSGNMVFDSAGAAELGETAAAEDQPGAADAGLTGLAFNWQTFTDADGNVITVENPEDYSLVLLPDGTFNIKADCNVGSGTYTYADDGSISFDLGPLTRALCPPDSLSDDFLAFVQNINTAVANPDGTVSVTTADGAEAGFLTAGPVEIPAVTTQPSPQVQPTGPASDPTGIIWNWTGSDDVTVDNPEQYQLILLPDSTYAVRADCNTGGGSYALDGDSLLIAPGVTSLAACPEGSLDRQFLDALFATESFAINEAGDLVLILADGAGTMTFSNGGAGTELTSQPSPQIQPPGPADPLEGTTWRWVNFRDAKQDYSIDGDYTISFLPDGQAAVVADCNNGNGSYTVDGSSLNVSILVVTAAACAEGSLDGVFIDYLNQAAIFTLNGTTMLVDLFADGGTMTFTQVP
jgi:heat shock protein HslJ